MLSHSGYYYGNRYPSLGQAIFAAVTVPILATWGGGWGGYQPGYWGGGYAPGACCNFLEASYNDAE